MIITYPASQQFDYSIYQTNLWITLDTLYSLFYSIQELIDASHEDINTHIIQYNVNQLECIIIRVQMSKVYI